MRWLADECVAAPLVARLREAGHNVVYAAETMAGATYKVSGGGTSASYPITAKGSASFSDSPLGADRVRIANERAMQQNIKSFLQALR